MKARSSQPVAEGSKMAGGPCYGCGGGGTCGHGKALGVRVAVVEGRIVEDEEGEGGVGERERRLHLEGGGEGRVCCPRAR